MLDIEKYKKKIGLGGHIQYTKKLVTCTIAMTFCFSVFGYYVSAKNGQYMNDIIVRWIDFATWLSGFYLAKAFAETYAEEKNSLEREVIKTKLNAIHEDSKPMYEDVEI